jgi:hypothetical protein
MKSSFHPYSKSAIPEATLPERDVPTMRSTIWILLQVPLLLIITSAFPPMQTADALEEGGFVCREETGAVNETWAFIKHFNWEQYYWAHPFEFTTSDASYVDNMDVAFFSGHGSNFHITTLRNCCDGVNFASGSVSLGDLDLEILTIDACSPVPSPIERDDWASGWWDVMHGLHQILSFHTTGWYDSRVEDQYAKNLINGQKFIDAWFNAANSVRSGVYPGYCAVIWAYPYGDHPGTANDTYYSYAPDPSYNLHIMAITYQY